MQRVCLLGGSGFVGRHLVAELARREVATRVITRRRNRVRHLLVVPTCEVVEGNVHAPGGLEAALGDCDAAVNLVGILNEESGSGETFQAAHAELPGRLAEACANAGVSRIVHMSALGAAADAPSAYLRTKWHGEEAVHTASENGIGVTSMRPSVIFGPEDSFFNRFAELLAVSPIVFPLACPDTRFAPVYVGDVVRAFATALADDSTIGRRFNLRGPREYTLSKLVEYTGDVCGHRRWVVKMNDALSRIQARVLERVPGKPFTMDNYLSAQVDNTCEPGDLESLGIEPTGLEGIVPQYLGARSRSRVFSRLRTTAGRT